MPSPKKKRQGRPPIDEITESQRRTLHAIKELTTQLGVPPTMREVAKLLRVSAANVQEQVDQLVRKAYLRREPRKARNLTVVQIPVDQISNLVVVPIVGTVTAGQPLLAEENIIGTVSIDANVVSKGRCFALKVVGDSMTGAGIQSGDLVIVRQQQMAENGEIVVAMRDGEATVKRLSFREDHVELRPENPRYRPIAIDPDDDFKILGKVLAVRRPLES